MASRDDMEALIAEALQTEDQEEAFVRAQCAQAYALARIAESVDGLGYDLRRIEGAIEKLAAVREP